MTTAVAELTADMATAEHAALAAEIEGHDVAYHRDDKPTITDGDYDARKRRLREIEAAFPALAKGSPSAGRSSPGSNR
jgi:DNA ligase (NAD+)